MKSDDFLYILREKNMRECTFFVLESVRDFYNFRVNHAQFYVNGNTAFCSFILNKSNIYA